jgi:DNA recombination protein RmuC
MGTIIIAGIIGFTLGAAIAWAVAASRRGPSESVLDGGAVVLEKELASAKAEINRLHSANALLQSNAASAEADKKNAEENLKSQVALMENAEARLKEAFAKAANEALLANNKHFLQLADQNFNSHKKEVTGELDARKQSIDQLVAPISEALNQYREETQKMEVKRQGDMGALGEQLKGLSQAQTTLQSETTKLVHALKSSSTRGRWGEIALKRIVELSGMSEFCRDLQQTVEGDEGKALRPDMVVHLPGGHELVIDSKSPMDAYWEYIDAPTDEKRNAALAKHTDSIKSHIRKLAKKEYWQNVVRSPEFVVMFIPGDSFLSAAVEHDRNIVEFAMSENVVLATPATLLALLKAVAYGWRQAQFAANAEKVQELGAALHDRIAKFMEHFAKIGSSLEVARKSFNDAVGSYERFVLPNVRKFKELGAGGSKELESIDEIETPIRTLHPPTE